MDPRARILDGMEKENFIRRLSVRDLDESRRLNLLRDERGAF